MGSPAPITVPRRRSLIGPVIMIAIGVLFLLVNAGMLTAKSVFVWFAHYWPLIIILWGVVKLIEYIDARNKGLPAPGIGAGGIVLLVILLVFGSGMSAAYRGLHNVNMDEVGDALDMNGEGIES